MTDYRAITRKALLDGQNCTQKEYEELAMAKMSAEFDMACCRAANRKGWNTRIPSCHKSVMPEYALGTTIKTNTGWYFALKWLEKTDSPGLHVHAGVEPLFCWMEHEYFK
jgi:hypothetical protein